VLSQLLGKTLQCETELLFFSKKNKLLWSLAEEPTKGATTNLSGRNIIENSDDRLIIKIERPFRISPVYTLKGPLTISKIGGRFAYESYKFSSQCSINGGAGTMRDYQKSSAKTWACGQDPSKKCSLKFRRQCGPNPSEECGKREGRRNGYL
jgi:hypothetical protein